MLLYINDFFVLPAAFYRLCNRCTVGTWQWLVETGHGCSLEQRFEASWSVLSWRTRLGASGWKILGRVWSGPFSVSRCVKSYLLPVTHAKGELDVQPVSAKPKKKSCRDCPLEIGPLFSWTAPEQVPEPNPENRYFPMLVEGTNEGNWLLVPWNSNIQLVGFNIRVYKKIGGMILILGSFPTILAVNGRSCLLFCQVFPKK